jgi:hypothetical protein
LAAKGVRVAILDVNAPPKDLLKEWDNTVKYFKCDVSNYDAVLEAHKKIEDEVMLAMNFNKMI